MIREITKEEAAAMAAEADALIAQIPAGKTLYPYLASLYRRIHAERMAELRALFVSPVVIGVAYDTGNDDEGGSYRAYDYTIEGACIASYSCGYEDSDGEAIAAMCAAMGMPFPEGVDPDELFDAALDLVGESDWLPAEGVMVDGLPVKSSDLKAVMDAIEQFTILMEAYTDDVEPDDGDFEITPTEGAPAPFAGKGNVFSALAERLVKDAA